MTDDRRRSATVVIRNYRPADKEAVDRAARLAFAEHRAHFENWAEIYSEWSEMSALAEHGTIIVAETEGAVAGAVCYLGPHTPRRRFYDPEWCIVRSLVVDPACQRQGIGASLAQACVDRAVADGHRVLALLTSSVMAPAIRIYEKLGFKKVRDFEKTGGEHWMLYCLQLPASPERPEPR